MLKQLILKTRPIFNNYTYIVRSGLAKGLKRKGGLGFIPKFELTPEEDFLQRLDLTGKVVYDIGAFEGIFTLFFARKVGEQGQVVTFEPNPFNYARVIENIKLNGFTNVRVRQIALGDQPGQLELTFRHSESGSGSMHPDIRARHKQEPKSKTVLVDVDTLDRQIATYQLPKPDLIKIDVEGLEPKILKGMSYILSTIQPDLFIELHGFLLNSHQIEYTREIVTLLQGAGYSIHHLESDSQMTSVESKHPTSGHFYCVVQSN